MIPIYIGPTGVGFETISIRNQHYIETTTNGLTYRIGQVECITGPTGPTGFQGPASVLTGPAHPMSDAVTGPTGIGIEALYYSQHTHAIRVLYTNGELVTYPPLQCPTGRAVVGHPGPTGPTGPDLHRVVVAPHGDNATAAHILSTYTDGSKLDGIAVSHCAGQTGATGPAGPDAGWGAMGATGPAGRDSWWGATGAEGPAGDTFRAVENIAYIPATESIRVYTDHGTVLKRLDHIRAAAGPPGPFRHGLIAYGQLDVPVRFVMVAKESVKRQFVLYRDISAILFLDSPIAYDMSYGVVRNHDLFEASGNSVISKRRILARVRMSWTGGANSLFHRPFVVLNAGQSQHIFPTLVGKLYPWIVDSEDAFCVMDAGDTLSVHAGAYAVHPVADSAPYAFDFETIRMEITRVHNL